MTRVYFDLETGGLSPNVPIIQIGAVAMKDGKELDRFEVKIQFDEKDCDPDALKKNNYDPQAWEMALSPLQAAAKFARFLDRFKTVAKVSKAGKPYTVAQLAGYNAAVFDAPRLQDWYKKLGLFLPADYKVLDVFQLALWFFQCGDEPESHKLGAVCEFFGIPLLNAHDALDDVLATAALGELLLKQLELAAEASAVDRMVDNLAHTVTAGG